MKLLDEHFGGCHFYFFYCCWSRMKQRTNNHNHKLIKKMFQYQNKTHVGLFSLRVSLNLRTREVASWRIWERMSVYGTGCIHLSHTVCGHRYVTGKNVATLLQPLSHDPFKKQINHRNSDLVCASCCYCGKITFLIKSSFHLFNRLLDLGR